MRHFDGADGDASGEHLALGDAAGHLTAQPQADVVAAGADGERGVEQASLGVAELDPVGAVGDVDGPGGGERRDGCVQTEQGDP